MAFSNTFIITRMEFWEGRTIPENLSRSATCETTLTQSLLY